MSNLLASDEHVEMETVSFGVLCSLTLYARFFFLTLFEISTLLANIKVVFFTFANKRNILWNHKTKQRLSALKPVWKIAERHFRIWAMLILRLKIFSQ